MVQKLASHSLLENVANLSTMNLDFINFFSESLKYQALFNLLKQCQHLSVCPSELTVSIYQSGGHEETEKKLSSLKQKSGLYFKDTYRDIPNPCSNSERELEGCFLGQGAQDPRPQSQRPWDSVTISTVLADTLQRMV